MYKSKYICLWCNKRCDKLFVCACKNKCSNNNVFCGDCVNKHGDICNNLNTCHNCKKQNIYLYGCNKTYTCTKTRIFCYNCSIDHNNNDCDNMNKC